MIRRLSLRIDPGSGDAGACGAALQGRGVEGSVRLVLPCSCHCASCTVGRPLLVLSGPGFPIREQRVGTAGWPSVEVVEGLSVS